MDILTIILIIATIIGIFTLPSAPIKRIEDILFSKMKHNQASTKVIDIKEIRESLGKKMNG